jgi:hypothetical protein
MTYERAKLSALILASMSFLILGTAAIPEQRPCKKPKVYVKVAFVDDLERKLNLDGKPFKTAQQWADDILKYVVDQLRQMAGDVEVIPSEAKVFTDDKPETPVEENAFSDDVPGEYTFKVIIGADYPRDLLTGEKNESELGYWPISSLGAADLGGTYVSVGAAVNLDLNKAILTSLAKTIGRDLETLIARYEATHFSSMRSPKLIVNLFPPGIVSPEDLERNADIAAVVEDCHGRRGKGSWIINSEPRRGSIDNKAGESRSANVTETDVTGSVLFRYRLQRGTDPGTERIVFAINGKGQELIRQFIFIKIKGLRIEAQADKKTVMPAEETNVRFTVYKTDTEGGQEPLPDRTVQVSAQGLVDGSAGPRGAVKTDGNGQAVVTFRAGNKDKSVKFIATYQPQGVPEPYPESVTGQAVVNVGKYDATLTVTSSIEERYRYERSRGAETIQHKDDKAISVEIHMPLAFDYVLDVPTAGQRWEYYHALSRELSSFAAFSTSERYRLTNYGDIGAETTRYVHHTASGAKFEAPFLNENVIIVFDSKSNKALKAVIPGEYGISYVRHIEDNLHTEQWNPKTGLKVDDKNDSRKEDAVFNTGPVEDMIPDPTGGSDQLESYVAELFKKRGLPPPADIPAKQKTKEHRIHPDFLVKHGDGTSSIGGEGRKSSFRPGPGSTRRVEKIFKWEITRTRGK